MGLERVGTFGEPAASNGTRVERMPQIKFVLWHKPVGLK
jgi:hypothetical protein